MRRAPSPGVFLLIGALLRVLFFWLSGRFLPVTGDEQDYFHGTGPLFEALTLQGSAAVDRVVGRGWFMPGMTLVLLPISRVTSDLAAARLWVGVINFALYALLVSRVRRLLGARSATVVAAVGALSPSWVAFSFVFWGEIIAGQLVVLLVLWLASLQRAIDGRRDAAWRWLALGVVAAALVYVRPNFVLLLPALLLVVLALYLDAEPFTRGVARAIRAGALGVLAFGAVLAPWSIALSQRVGAFYPTTTSLDLNLILSFAPPERLALPAHPDGPSLAYQERLDGEMTRRGLRYGELLREERRRMLADVELASYARAAAGNAGAYLFDENLFLRRFESLTLARQPGAGVAQAYAGFALLNTVVWYPCLVLALVGLVVPWGLSGRLFWLVPALKLAFCVAAVQPFVSLAHGRHAVALLPIMAAGIAAGVSERPRWFVRAGAPTAGRRLMLATQLALSAVAIAAAVLVGWGAS